MEIMKKVTLTSWLVLSLTLATMAAEATEISFQGTTGADCIYFGWVGKRLKVSPYTWYEGPGICVWDQGYCENTSYFNHASMTTTTTYDIYKVCGDSCVYNSGSNDDIQFSVHSSWDSCGSDATYDYWVKNAMGSTSASIFLIWGDGGDDEINLCNDSVCNVYWDEVENRADGRYGNDTVWGTPSDDLLWGMNGSDIIAARAGDDYLEGGEGDCDYLDGGTETTDDTCYCNAGNYDYRVNCELPISGHECEGYYPASCSTY